MSGRHVTRGPVAPRGAATPPRPYSVCTGCGCTLDDACLADGVPCGWASPYRCTRCEIVMSEDAA